MQYPSDTDRRFIELFDGHPDIYGTELGGCVREPLSEGFSHHLQYGIPCGVYPVYGGWTVWGCVDLDIKTDKKPSGDYETEEECDQAADRLCLALEYFRCSSSKERTRSYGRHVWVFCEEPVPSYLMRRALYVACKLADVTTREVNPKQEKLVGDSVGNYVRLPYPNRLSDSGGGRVFLFGEEPLCYEDAVANIRYVDVQGLATLASFYTEKPRQVSNPIPYSSTYRPEGTTTSGIVAWARRITPDDRSAALWWVANTLRSEGVSSAEAEAVLAECCKQWGKHDGREMKEITRLLGKVYA